jgi:hypothetical protein
MESAISRRAALGLLAALPVAAGAARLPSGPTRSVITATDGREIALWRWAAQGRRTGTIAFSHGAASAPWKYPGVLDRWAAAGFDVVAPLHVDSIDHPHHADFKGLAGWAARIEDMRAVSRHIGHDYIAAGHSFGALSALVLGGATPVLPLGVTGPTRDPRAVRVVAFSPPPPIPVLITAAGYATLAAPALIETGTHDLLPGTTDPQGWHNHLAAYDVAAPGNHRYALVLDGVDHYFGGAICDSAQPGPPQTAALAQAVALSLLFMATPAERHRLDFARIDARLSQNGPVQLLSK